MHKKQTKGDHLTDEDSRADRLQGQNNRLKYSVSNSPLYLQLLYRLRFLQINLDCGKSIRYSK